MKKKLSFLKSYSRAYLQRKSPSYLVFFITTRCNSNCNICFFWENIKKGDHANELTLDEIQKISKKAGNIIQLLLSGGEPFLRKDISDIVRSFTQNAGTRLVSIPTNASLPEKIENDVIKILTDNDNIHLNINISLDGIGDDHDVIRGHPGCYEKLVDTYHRLKKIKSHYGNLGINIQTVFTKKNHEKMESLAAFVSENYEVDFHGFSVVRGNTPDMDIKDISFERAFEIHEIMDKFSSKRKSSLPFKKSINPIFALMKEYYLDTLKYNKRVFPCLAGNKLIVLSQKGDLLPCEPFWFESETRGKNSLSDLTFGNVRDFDYNISSVLDTKKAANIRSYVSQKKCYCLWGCTYFCSILYHPVSQIRLLKKFFV
jgi:MoaA/NifB/PqqE/SkfB family radical SAM enzyme